MTFVGQVREALASGDRERVFDAALDRFAVKALRRTWRRPSLSRMVCEAVAGLLRERSRALTGAEAALHHDLALLFDHSRFAARPLVLLREADVLKGGRHRPSARRRWGDRRPFTQYLSDVREAVDMLPKEQGDYLLWDARRLSEQLNDPYLRSDVEDFLRALGAETSRRPTPEPSATRATPPTIPNGTTTTEQAVRDLLSQEEQALREAERQEERFHRTMDPDALDGALQAMGQASQYAVLAGVPLRALGHGMDVGRLLAARFSHSGDWDDLGHAVASMRLVINQLPPDHPAVASSLLQLGVTLIGGHEQAFGQYGPRCGTEYIDAAIAELRRARRAAEAEAPDHADLPGVILTMLGHSLLLRVLVRTDADAAHQDMAEAVGLLDQATALLGDGGDGPDLPLTASWDNPERDQVASMLRMYRVQAAMMRAVADGDVAALEELTGTVRRRLHTATSLTRPQWQTILGGIQVFADTLAGRTTTDPSVSALLNQAARGGTGSEGPQRALRVARLAATVALRQRQWAEATELLGESLRQIHAQRAHGIPDSARLAWLQQGRDFAQDLVTCLVALGRAREAVVAFEENRAVLLSEALGDRADIVGLDRVAPVLARDHRTAARELRRFESGTDALRPDNRARRRRLLDGRDRVAERIRKVEGFERFGKPLRFADLTMGTHEGPAVLLNIGSSRGDALVLQDGGVHVIPLPHAHGDRLEAATGALHRALRAAERARAGGDDPAFLRQQRAVTEVLEQLWDWVAAPVWEGIGGGGTAGDPPRRVWWVPSGWLWFLPLHAASSPGGPSLADLAVSSYAPTLRMLKLGRRRTWAGPGSPLVVSVPHAPGVAPLPGAEEEARVVAALVPGARVLRGPAATREAVLDGLGRHPCLHFAGHGINTSDGTLLVLQDSEEHPLTAQDVLEQELPGSDLAYLSACETAQTSPLLPDEATHFGAALAVAGYRHVIGTLWRVDDSLTAQVARRFYGHLTDADADADAVTDPALALHRTVRELRAAYPSMPGLWAAHLHIGP